MSDLSDKGTRQWFSLGADSEGFNDINKIFVLTGSIGPLFGLCLQVNNACESHSIEEGRDSFGIGGIGVCQCSDHEPLGRKQASQADVLPCTHLQETANLLVGIHQPVRSQSIFSQLINAMVKLELGDQQEPLRPGELFHLDSPFVLFLKKFWRFFVAGAKQILAVQFPVVANDVMDMQVDWQALHWDFS